MSFHSPESKASTTEPNTPEPLPIEEENEESPSGDFARLYSVSRSARIAFNDLVLAMEDHPEKYRWHRRFVYVRPTLEELEAEPDEQSTGDELVPSPRPQSPSLVRGGFWRLNITDLHPLNRHLGWVLGKGRWNTRETNPNGGTGGGTDILLTANAKEPLLRGRHARLLHSLESYALMVAADKKLRVGHNYLNPTDVSAIGQRKTVLAFGHMEYELVFTNLDQSIYKAQLDQLSRLLNYQGLRPGAFVDPTPAETDYMIMNKYVIRSSFTHGSTCWMCTAVDKDTGASVAVKKIIAQSSKSVACVHKEITAMKKLSSGYSPPSIAKLIDFIFIEPSKASSGATECFIISQPLLIGTLGQLLTSPLLPISSRLSLFEQMLEGLAFLHGKGCMHRDIKPDNILASDSPIQAVIIDFGCATWDKTSDDHMKGTIRYLAPEIIALKDKSAPPNTTYDISADVWGMGLTAYELMNRSRVTFGRISRKLYNEEFIPNIISGYSHLDESGNWAASLIEKMLHWNPKSRIKAEQAYQQCPLFKAGREQRQLQVGKREHESD